VTAARVILVSDTHLSSSAPRAQSNWDAVLRHVHAAGPDLVIHLGDLTQDGAYDAAALRHGRAQLDRLPVPWRAIPGNHDVGDNPWPGAPEGSAVDAARHQRWLDIVGADHWSATIGGWTVLAVNAQLPSSGLAAESAQWSWLEEQARANRGQPVALITHKPVTAPGAELAAAPPYRFWPQPAFRRLAGLFGGRPPALVLSGHLHQYRMLTLGSTDHLWAPAAWAVLPDQVQPVFGVKRCGILSLTLTAGAPVKQELIEPDGLEQLTVAADNAVRATPPTGGASARPASRPGPRR
jgi:predicted phosphodiesterase